MRRNFSMSDDAEDFEFALIFRTNDPSLRQDLERVVPPGDISVSDNFVGSAEIAIFLKYGSDMLKTIMDVLNHRTAAVAGARIVVGKEEFKLEGYSAEEAARIINSPGFLAALKSTQRSR
jgi:hypothetical protein